MCAAVCLSVCASVCLSVCASVCLACVPLSALVCVLLSALVCVEMMEIEDGVWWKQDLERSLRMFGWEGLGTEGSSSLLTDEVNQMLKDVAWRQVVESWRVARGKKSLQVS